MKYKHCIFSQDQKIEIYHLNTKLVGHTIIYILDYFDQFFVADKSWCNFAANDHRLWWTPEPTVGAYGRRLSTLVVVPRAKDIAFEIL